ncbi:hypothetical protein [Gaiella sp.]|jgi:hypothetical protein|uniref:hypothetical protein n=1 Tax=Gaiella sp. TaxID=2663207 RepID=UPI002E37DACA|nr:hypothetical protein [Gaiella sp.]HEX5582075.1 hypothetical protein [Gaiella sp.]
MQDDQFFGLLGEDVGVLRITSTDDRPAPKHHEKFDQALQDAVDKVRGDDGEWYEVKCYVRIRHSSPGWVDGYSIQLVEPGGR